MVYKVVMEDETIRKGPWLEEEDERLETFVTLMGERRWDSIARVSSLRRSGKSCRLRWMNYLRPDLKHGRMTAEEENTVLQLQERWGNKWSKIARKLPGRTDNEIKNYWRTHLRKKTQEKLQRENKNAMKLSPNSKEITLGNDSMTGSVNGFESSNDLYGATSPYENHLSDWVSGSSSSNGNQEVVLKHNGQCKNPWFQYSTHLARDNVDSNTSIWDYNSVSLWEMK